MLCIAAGRGGGDASFLTGIEIKSSKHILSLRPQPQKQQQQQEDSTI